MTHFMPEHGEAIADSTNRCHLDLRHYTKLGMVSTNNCGNRLLREGAMDKMHCALPTSAGS